MKWLTLFLFLTSTTSITQSSDRFSHYQIQSSKSREVFTGKNIVIGDSQTPYVDWGSSEFIRLGETPGMINLWEGGKTLNWLLQSVKSHKVDTTVCNVAISIGTNGGFNSKRDSIKSLVKNLELKFPNSKLWVIQGSWGWGGVANETESGVRLYYKEFEKLGVTIVEPPIGKIEPHGKKPIYKVIGSNLDSLVKL